MLAGPAEAYNMFISTSDGMIGLAMHLFLVGTTIHTTGRSGALGLFSLHRAKITNEIILIKFQYLT